MLTHVHKVIHLVVGTFEKGEEVRGEKELVSLAIHLPDAGPLVDLRIQPCMVVKMPTSVNDRTLGHG